MLWRILCLFIVDKIKKKSKRKQIEYPFTRKEPTCKKYDKQMIYSVKHHQRKKEHSIGIKYLGREMDKHVTNSKA